MSKWSEMDPATFLREGTWAIGQGPNAPDRLLLRHMIRAMSKQLKPVHVLDFGFGSGIDAQAVYDDGLHERCEYVGIDGTEEFVAAAREKFPWGRWEVADVHDFCARQGNNPSPWAKQSDLTWARHVLEHVDDGLAALGQLWRSTRGVLIVSWFIRPSWLDAEVGNKEAEGFAHWTYPAKRWIGRAAQLNAHLARIDYDHGSSRASIWVLARPGYEAAILHATKFAQSAAFRDACLPAVDLTPQYTRDALVDLLAAGEGLEGMNERIRDLEYVNEVAEKALGRAELFMEPSQDDPAIAGEIRAVRDAKGRCAAAREGRRPDGDDGRDRTWRDARRKAADLLEHGKPA